MTRQEVDIAIDWAAAEGWNPGMYDIDGMHQRAGTRNVIELHGSLWRLRCPSHGRFEDTAEAYHHYACSHCNT